MNFLYMYIQHLVVEINSYELPEVMGFNAGRNLITISDIELDNVSEFFLKTSVTHTTTCSDACSITKT